MCKWKEPPLDLFRPEPDCTVSTEAHPAPERTLQGRLLRITSCELMYGPLNCDFAWRPYNGYALSSPAQFSLASCWFSMLWIAQNHGCTGQHPCYLMLCLRILSCTPQTLDVLGSLCAVYCFELRFPCYVLLISLDVLSCGAVLMDCQS